MLGLCAMATWLGCGDGPAQPEYPLPDVVEIETAGAEAPTGDASGVATLTAPSVGLLGSFQRSESGGPISLVATWTFTADRYEMTGYPSIGERGRVEVLSRTGEVARVRFSERMYCGPCESRGPDTPRETEDIDIRIAPDGQSIEMRGFVFRRVAAP